MRILANSFLILISLLLTACPSAPIPKINVSLWAGDSERQGITRAQEKKTMACSDPQMDEFVCLTYEDLRRIYGLVLSCQKWGAQVSDQNFKVFLDKNADVHNILFEKGLTPISQPIDIPKKEVKKSKSGF